MKFRYRDTCYRVSFPAVAFLALALISDARRTFLWCMLSSAFHELGHVFAMQRYRVKITSVSFNLGDIRIVSDCNKLSMNQDLIVSLSGAAANFLLCFISSVLYLIFKSVIFADIMGVNLCIGLFNLLPIRYLDGGQVLENILLKYTNQSLAARILNIISILFLIPVAVVGFLFVLKAEYNFSLLFAVLYLICTIVSKELL